MTSDRSQKTMVLGICNACAATKPDLACLRIAMTKAGLNERVKINPVPCLGSGTDPTTIVMQAAKSASYVFSGVSLESDADDIVKTCALYLNSLDGWIEDARPCGRLRFLLKARMPA